MPTPESQMALFPPPPPVDGAGVEHGAVAARPPVRLGLSLSHGAWLDWLADEWWPASEGSASVRLGIGAARGQRAEQGGITVLAWIDSSLLPVVDVPAWDERSWARRHLFDLDDRVREISWPGPIPLHAVTSFSVASESDRSRLLAMAKGFANVVLPAQPVEVAKLDLLPSAPEEPPRIGDLALPEGWNARRGAAAMAVHAVPAIAPWLDLLCDALALDPVPASPDRRHARWLAEPPWRPRRTADTGGDGQLQLWRAAIDVLGAVRMREAWRPHEVAEAIRDRACAEHGATPASLDAFMAVTRALLADERPAETALSPNDPVGSAIQLTLLRPLPERFARWAQDVPALPPGVWWTGTMLAGLVRGHRDLEQKFRGTPEGRRRLALRIWQLCKPDGAKWPGGTDSPPTWHLEEGGRAALLWDGRRWADRSIASRGWWYEADLARRDVRRAAMALARKLQPSCLLRALDLENVPLPYSGEGRVQIVEGAHPHLSIEKKVRFHIPPDVEIVDDLDDEAFRNWVARDGIVERLPDPPAIRRERVVLELSDSQPVIVPGLQLLPEIVTEAEEGALLAEIDRQSWSKALSRRVQHYGWTYNYKARKIEPDAYLGPLPEWAARLGMRLVARGLMPEPPDQLIVNEYVGKQGIARHVDCLPCFKGPIVMISLGDRREMFFWPPRGGDKVIRTLERRSATVLSGEAREKWAHEIPRRVKEPWGPRERRVSLTFRKVIAPVAEPPKDGAPRRSRKKTKP